MAVTRFDRCTTRVNTDRSVSLVNDRGIELCRTVSGVVPGYRNCSIGWNPGGTGYEIRIDGRVVPLSRGD